MSEPRTQVRGRRSPVWLVVLGACTLWLVVQNTLLFTALVWAEPARLVTVGGVLFRAGMTVMAACWPAALIVLAALVPFALMLRAALRLERHEVRHG
jgi:hypothetical protein